MDLKNLIKEVIKISKSAGELIEDNKKNFHFSDIEKKGINDYVSYVDKSAELFIIDKLKSLIPQAGFIVEEKTVEYKGEDYKWIIDPLDGTTNFIHGFFPYSVSIALMKNQDLLLGVIYELGLNECFYAFKNGGAYLNEKIINVSSTKNLSDSLLATGFPYDDFSKIDKYLALLKYFTKNTRGIRRLGSAAVDIAYVACGRFDGFYEYSLNEWDVAAGVIILKEAGGKVCDFKGGNNFLFGKEIIVSNPYIYENFKKIIVKYME